MTTHLRTDVLSCLLYLLCPVLHYCGDYSRCITTWFNRAWFCLHSRAAQCSRVLSSNRRSCPAPFVIPAVHWKRLQSGGKGEKKSMLSNAEIGKCHFDKCKALCTHRLNFDGSLPRRGLLFLFISLHTKMLNNDVTESKYKCHQHKRSPDEPEILFFSENVFPQRSTGIWSFSEKRTRLFLGKCYTRLYFDTLCQGVFACVTSMQMNLH